MKRTRPLQLSTEERSTLEDWISLAPRHGASARRAARAAVVLALADGLNVHAIANRFHVQPSTTRKWRRRFVQERLSGLHDRARTGAPRRIAPERIDDVLLLAREPTPDGARPWSTRMLAKVTGLSCSTVHRMMRNATRLQATDGGR